MKDSATSQHRPLYRDKRGPIHPAAASGRVDDSGGRCAVVRCAFADICLEQVARISPASIDIKLVEEGIRQNTHTAYTQ